MAYFLQFQILVRLVLQTDIFYSNIISKLIDRNNLSFIKR